MTFLDKQYQSEIPSFIIL